MLLKSLTWSMRWVAVVFHLNNVSKNCPHNCLRGYKADPEHKAREVERAAFCTPQCHNSKSNVRVCLFSNRDSDEIAP